MTRPVMLSLAVLCLTGAAWAFGSQATPALDALAPDEVQRFTGVWAQQPRVDLGVPAGAARVIVVKFNDWLCPACKAWHEAYQPLLDKYEKETPGAVKYVVKDWPWNSNCNITLKQTFGGHESSCEAAVAVRIARDRGKEREMVAWLFNEQPNLVELRMQAGAATKRVIANATNLLGLKPGDFEREYPLRLQVVRQDVIEGVAVHMEVTPTYYVNGIKTTSPIDPTTGRGGDNLPPNYLDLAIKLELKKAAGK